MIKIKENAHRFTCSFCGCKGSEKIEMFTQKKQMEGVGRKFICGGCIRIAKPVLK